MEHRNVGCLSICNGCDMTDDVTRDVMCDVMCDVTRDVTHGVVHDEQLSGRNGRVSKPGWWGRRPHTF